ncbi:hypothetical protein OEZ86_008259 [Tetradesmus obliquus]|nr:hypothetical protein OEZ86_008259 [Tetradesmus obliquus]
MPQSAVKVFLRTRPSDVYSPEQLQVNQDTKTFTIVQAARSSGLPSDKAGPSQQYQFKFDGILHNASQEDVFEVCATDVLSSALEGYNSTIMCYGQTGAGKTHTMAGSRASYAARGLIPRVISALLARLGAAPGLAAWSVSVSYLEIYNEALYDLLDLTAQPQELALYEDGRGRVQVSGLRQVAVASEAEALALFFEGESNRVIGEHQLNKQSSRSHSIFMLSITTTPEGGDGRSLASKLCLVDLAGSERVSKTRSEGLVLKEAGHINRSLALLEQVVRAASERGRDHVPYRSSKLTHVLKDSLGGNCATVLIANVWGEPAQLDETLSTCRFAARMARLVCEVASNVVQEGGARVRELQREVQELKEELAMMQLMAGWQQQQQQEGSNSSRERPYDDTQRQKLQQAVLAWLQLPADADSSGSTLSQLPLSSVRQLRELLLAVKVGAAVDGKNWNVCPC